MSGNLCYNGNSLVMKGTDVKLNLYQIQHCNNKYCGPSAISALTGLPTNQCTAIIREVNDHGNAVRGFGPQPMLRTLYALGIGARQVRDKADKTQKKNLRTWVKDHSKGDDIYLVIAGNHWIIVNGKHAMCGWTKDLVYVDDHPFARKFVTDVWKLARFKAVDPSTLVPAKSNANAAEAAAKRKAKRLAHEYWIYIDEIHESSIGPYPPDDKISEEDDPFEGDHYRSTWVEVLEMVEKYVEILKAKEAT